MTSLAETGSSSSRSLPDRPPEQRALGTLDPVERRWRAIQKVVNHDLSNQLIAVQGLVQLLAMEEMEQLRPESREVLRRLQASSARAVEMVHLLKALAKAGEAPERPELVLLDDLAAEAGAEVKQRFPEVVVEQQFAAGLDRVLAGPRALHQALVQLLRLAILAAGTEKTTVSISAKESPHGLELWVGSIEAWATARVGRISNPSGQEGSPSTTPTSPLAHALGAGDRPESVPADSVPADSVPAWSTRALEDRLEALLVRELAWGMGGDLKLCQEPGRGCWFILQMKLSAVSDQLSAEG